MPCAMYLVFILQVIFTVTVIDDKLMYFIFKFAENKQNTKEGKLISLTKGNSFLTFSRFYISLYLYLHMTFALL